MKDDRIYFEYILLCIEKIEDYTKNRKNLVYGINHCSGCRGSQFASSAESTQRISDNVKKNYPGTEWQAISGFRNILVHDYLGLDLKLIWSVVEKRLPPLRLEIEKMLKDAG
jgi:uncharacterized protein with HEPN domain